MPHNLYLHSALVQTRKIKRDEKGIKQALKYNFIDSAIALNLAFLVNAAILILAATVFFSKGFTGVAEIKEAHRLLDGILGTQLAPVLFAVALIAAGQSSTVTGTLAGQIVMEGYLRLRINPWIRRLMTRMIAIIPAVIVILVYGENNIDNLLVLSQVILSLQLGFAIIPLIHFVSDKEKMGAFSIKPFVQLLAWLITAVLVYLNIRMVSGEAIEYFHTSDNVYWKSVIVIGGLLYVALMLAAIIYPLVKKKVQPVSVQVHKEDVLVNRLEPPAYSRIAVALEFSPYDHQVLSHAIGQANEQTSFVLIHVVESVPAKILGADSDDLETRKDFEKLEEYAQILKEKGFSAESKLGFKNRVKEIVRIVKESKADLLVIGAHGHSGVKDLLYGTTIDSVRHQVEIPVFIVRIGD
jgi:manganese transport protein